jgi:signal peptidase II
MSRLTVVVVLAVVVFVADQLVKVWALRTLDVLHPIVLVPGLAQLTLVMNPGVAFGIFATIPPGWRWLVPLFSMTALALLASLATRVVPGGSWRGRTAVGLVFGGAAGNLLDRWRYGAVVDFVDLHWRGYHWPAFNVADSAITIGVVLLATEMALGGRPDDRGTRRA